MKVYKSPAYAVVHQCMEDICRNGGASPRTMRHFDEMCLCTVRDMEPADIKALRERENLSQSVFARYLNVSKNIVSEWERGIKKPGGPAMRLLSLINERGLDIFHQSMPAGKNEAR